MELTQLKHFKAAAEMNNLTKAAQSLYVTQPTLSKSIANLERELGISLFEHSKKRISLNENGRFVLQQVNSILDAVDSIENFAKWHKLQMTSIFLVADTPLCLYPVIQAYRRVNPDVFWRTEIMDTDEIADSLCSGFANAAITAREIVWDDVTCMPLYKEEFFVSCPAGHPLYNQEIIQLGDLAGNTIIVPAEKSKDMENVCAAFRRLGIEPVLYPVTDMFLYSGVIQSKRFLILTSNILTSFTHFDGDVRYIPIVEKIPGLTYYQYYLSYRKSGNHPDGFLEWCQKNRNAIVEQADQE